MSRIIKVSRHRLTRCPGCAAHIKVAAELAATRCPFCGETLRAAPRHSQGLLGAARELVNHHRSGLIAASLLGLSAMAAPGCGSDDDRSSDTSDSDLIEEGGTQDLGAQDYGGPGIDEFEDTADGNTDGSGDTGSGDTGEDAEVVEEDAPDAGGEQDYGAPPMDDVAP